MLRKLVSLAFNTNLSFFGNGSHMPRQAAAIKGKSRSKSKRNNFVETVKVFFARRIQDICAIFLMITGVFLALSFVSYKETDPSLNAAQGPVDVTVQNWFGLAGAYSSDFFLQIFGAAAFLIVFTLVNWGARLWKRRFLGNLFLRGATLVLALVMLSVAFARIPSGDWLPHVNAGGAGGAMLLNKFSSFISPLIGGWAFTVVAFVSGIIGIILASFAVPVTKENWKNAGVKLLELMAFIGSAIHRFGAWIRHYNDPDYIASEKAPIVKKPQANKKEPPLVSNVLSNNEKAIAVVAPQKDVKSMPKKKASTQQSLSFDGEWEFPATTLMQDLPKSFGETIDEVSLRNNADLLQSVLEDYNVEGEITSIHPGPVVTLYEFEPAPGIKSSRVIGLSDDIARSMSAISVRASVVPGRNVIGIEIPNKTRQTVYMREMLELPEYEDTKVKLPLILGKDIGGKPVIADLTKMPHLLVAGTTGSGKSVGVNTMIMSLLYKLSPEKCRLIMIDPKMLELSVYNDIPHLLSEVVTEPGRAVVALKWAVAEMENRYRAMSKLGVRNIDGYNSRMEEARKKGEVLMRKVQTGFDGDSGKPVFEDQPMDMSELPYIVIIVDEFADLMLVAGKDVEGAIQRLAQMARAAGIHLIMATQRPSVDVITGVIKANFPTRISFQVTSKIDSRTILGDGGAEQLLGMGDMLYMAGGGRVKRVHGPFTSDEDVESVVTFLKQQGEPSYLDDVTEGSFDNGLDLLGDGGSSGSDVDELYDQAVALVAREQKASTSFVQRYLQIGYNRAARIVEEMEKQGVIGPANHVGKREILVSDHSGE